MVCFKHGAGGICYGTGFTGKISGPAGISEGARQCGRRFLRRRGLHVPAAGGPRRSGGWGRGRHRIVLPPEQSAQLLEAQRFCTQNNIRHIICKSEELDIAGFRQNPKNRCYLCKHELFEKIWTIAKEHQLAAVAEGSNTDDTGDYRPGLVAVAELGVKSPLREAGLNKEEIRALSKALGLPTWNKQSFACLSSRFVYGETITEEKLKMVDQAEQLLLDLGFHQVRVRIHGTIARIELLPQEFEKLLSEDVRKTVCRRFKALGFSYVTLDLLGYRTGSMNETL